MTTSRKTQRWNFLALIEPTSREALETLCRTDWTFFYSFSKTSTLPSACETTPFRRGTEGSSTHPTGPINGTRGQQTRRQHRGRMYREPPGVVGADRMQGGSQRPFFAAHLVIFPVRLHRTDSMKTKEAVTPCKGARVLFELDRGERDGPPLVWG